MAFEYITQDYEFNLSSIKTIEDEFPMYYVYPSTYILYCKDSKKAYVGESTNILNRLKQHLNNANKKKLKNVKVIFSQYFNKSSVLDIESNLIQYMLADKEYKLLNANIGISNHHYYQKNEYQSTFREIWQNLQLEKLANHDILSIQNSDLFKYSPYKSLSTDQYNAIKEYLYVLLGAKQNTSTFIQGSAGTGKTILAVYLLKLLVSKIDRDDLGEEIEISPLIELSEKVQEKLRKTKEKPNIAFVIPVTSLRKTLQKVFRSIEGLSAKMVIGPNDVSKDRFDLLVVDESHRLKKRKNITGYKEFDKTNRFFNLEREQGTELDWIMLSSSNQLFFYDDKQSVRPSDVDKVCFDEIRDKSIKIELKSQMRVEGGEDYIEFINKLLNTSSSLQAWHSKKYDLKLFTSMKEMLAVLEEKEKTYGLCRTISGYSWKWVSKKSSKPDVVIDGEKLYWNRTNQDWINSTTSVNEMGCIHTTQGYDLNYAAVIFGSDITYNEETKKIEVIKENYYDRNGKAGITEEQLHDYILNIYKTIMYRAIKGTFVYCFDKKLEKYFKKYIS